MLLIQIVNYIIVQNKSASKQKKKLLSNLKVEDKEYEELMIDIDDDGWIELNKYDPEKYHLIAI